MDYSQMSRQMIGFHQHVFNTTFNMMVLFQDQVEKVSDLMVENARWLPAEAKAVFDEWTLAVKQGREGYKQLADNAFRYMEAVWTPA